MDCDTCIHNGCQSTFPSQCTGCTSTEKEVKTHYEPIGRDDNYCQCLDDEFIDFVRYCGNCGKRIKFD